jgi:monoamine oxidase
MPLPTTATADDGDDHPAAQTHFAVAIVGAGFAGLQAATTLLRAGIRDVVVLEASDRVGGRVRSLTGFAPWAVEAGAEFVHGGNTALRRLLAGAGCALNEYAWPDRWWFEGEAGGLVKDKGSAGGSRAWRACCAQPPTSTDDSPDPDLARVHALFAGVGKEPYPRPGSDVSARDWLTTTHGASPRQAAIAEACYANDFGADLESLGLTELIIENRRWDAGEAYLVSDRPLADVAAHMAAGLPAGSVRLGWPVSGVEVVSGGGGEGSDAPTTVRLTGPGGDRLAASTVIIAVPLGILQAGRIVFNPPLPPDKAGALARIRVGRATKIILGFSHAFWPADFFDAVCPGGFVPEFWTVGGAKARIGEGQAAVDGVAAVMTGFLAGRFAEKAAAAGEAETVRRALAQLDAMFGTSGESTPASDAFVRAHVADWAADPHALGAYSFPSTGARVGDRGALASPAWGGALLFAGEATHPAVNPCVQAALETGVRAGREAAARVKRARRRKRWGKA